MIGKAFHESMQATQAFLFQPFRGEYWVKMAFFFFLSHLVYFGVSPGFSFSWRDGSWKGFSSLSPYLLLFGVFIVLILLGLWVGFLYLSSRGKFMVMEGLVRQEATVREAWEGRKKEAFSLFLFQLLLFLLGVLVFASVAMGWFYVGVRRPNFFVGMHILWMVLSFLFILALFLTVVELLNDFIVPIQYFDQVSVWEAWGILGKLLIRYPVAFLLFYLLKWLIVVVVGIGVVVVSFLTCCLGFVILALPFVKECFLLPFYYFLRYFSVSFLGKMEKNYECLPKV